MTLTALIGLINTLSSLSLAGFVYWKNPKNRVNQSYLFFGLSVGLYSYGYTLWGNAVSSGDALLAFKILTAGIILINSAYLQFIGVLLNKLERQKTILVLCHVVNAVFLLLNFNLILYGDVRHGFWGYWPIVQWPFYAYILIWLLQFLYGAIQLKLGYESNIGRRATQIKFVFVSTLIGYLGGASNWLPWFHIDIPPHLNVLVSAYVAILAYAIVRHQLMNIDVLIKKTLVFAGLFGMVMTVIAAVTAITQDLFGVWLKMPALVTRIFSIALAVVAYEPTKQFLIALTDKYLFQKKENILATLQELSDQITSVLDLSQVGNTVLVTLEKSIRFESGAIMLRNEKTGKYEALKAVGMRRKALAYPENDPLMQYFKANEKVLDLEDSAQREKLPPAVLDGLTNMQAVIVVPLIVQDSLLGILALGKKKSDQGYDHEELAFFPIMASQIALAIRNALLIKDLVEEREEKLKALNEAKMVGYGKSVAHEIKNALAGFYDPAQFMTLFGQQDFMKYFDAYLRGNVSEIAEKKFIELLAKMKKEGEKIFLKADEIWVVAKTAEGTLSNDEGDFREFSMKVVWDAALRNINMGSCMTIRELPPKFFPYGNVVLMMRVVANLMTNALDAMAGRENSKIILRGRYEEMNGRKGTYFEFVDNGPGIPSDILDKIFVQGFSTKPKPDESDMQSSGHGQGLWVCKHIIEDIHNGKLWVESETGTGTAFKFWLPAKPDEKEAG